MTDSAPLKGSIVALSVADPSGSVTDQKTSLSAVSSGWIDASYEAEAYGSTIRSGPVTVISSASTGCSPADSDSDGGSSSTPQSVFGSLPIHSSRVPPETRSSWGNHALSQRSPFSSAPWM